MNVLPYAVAIFVSAFLLFQIQPIIAKIILPWFGGSAAVWTTCLLFFQIVLLMGYCYAHLSVRYFSNQARIAEALAAAWLGRPAIPPWLAPGTFTSIVGMPRVWSAV